MKTDETFKLLEQALLNSGLNYRATLGSNTTVELIDSLTNTVLATSVSETLEEGLTSAIAQVLKKTSPQDMLSVL